jgi:hypothetical protein
MKYRIAEILARQQYSADKTEPIKIQITQPISRIVVTYEPDNNPSGANATGHPALCIPQITLQNGSDKLFSLTGQETQGVDFYDNRVVPPNQMIYLTGNYSEMIFNINFGNFLYDPDWCLLTEMFKNLYLNISINIDGGGDEADDGYLTVFAHIFDDMAVSPKGFLMTKEEKDYVLVSSGHEYTDLPVDYPYKQIFVRPQRYGTGPEYQINQVTLGINNKAVIPVDMTMFQVLRNIVQVYPPYFESILVPGLTSAQYFYCTPCYWPTFQDTQWREEVATAEASVYSGDGGRFTHDAEAAGPNHQILARGWAPHAMVPILPIRSDGREEMFEFGSNDKLRLDLEGSSSVGTSQTCQIVTQQYRAY